jgi:hypothetical protein
MLPESIRVGCSPTNSPGQPRGPAGIGRAARLCPARRQRGRAAIDRLGRSVAEVTRTIADLVNGESLCVSHARASIRPRQQGELSRPSWPASPNWNSNWAASARRIPRIPSRPASAGHQTPEAQPRTARTVAPACCDRGACASTGRSVRNRTSNCIPLSLLFPNLRVPEWLLASARLMRSR